MILQNAVHNIGRQRRRMRSKHWRPPKLYLFQHHLFIPTYFNGFTCGLAGALALGGSLVATARLLGEGTGALPLGEIRKALRVGRETLRTRPRASSCDDRDGISPN